MLFSHVLPFLPPSTVNVTFPHHTTWNLFFRQVIFPGRLYCPASRDLYDIRRCIQKFPDWSITKYTLTTINTRWEATERVMAAKLNRLTHKIVMQLHLVAKSCIICSSRSRRPVRKLLYTPSYIRVRNVRSPPTDCPREGGSSCYGIRKGFR
jgi:hypothetical protein